MPSEAELDRVIHDVMRVLRPHAAEVLAWPELEGNDCKLRLGRY